jgi:hypothetical protein
MYFTTIRYHFIARKYVLNPYSYFIILLIRGLWTQFKRIIWYARTQFRQNILFTRTQFVQNVKLVLFSDPTQMQPFPLLKSNRNHLQIIININININILVRRTKWIQYLINRVLKIVFKQNHKFQKYFQIKLYKKEKVQKFVNLLD